MRSLLNSGRPRNESAAFQACVCSFVLVLMHRFDALSMFSYSPLLDDMYYMSSWTASAFFDDGHQRLCYSMSKSHLHSSCLVLTAGAHSVDLCDMKI